MVLKLRELIRNVRSCKTAAEERAVIAKESALIRTSFKNQDNQYRHRNVAKLLYIHMLGYPSHFGQMECLKLIASNNFSDKRMGYLGLVLLLTDQEDVLTLVTNSLKNDMNNSNQYVAGLSLTTVGNIASADMARDLAVDIEKHLKGEHELLRKKAALTSIRMFKKVPELVEDFAETIRSLLKCKNHGTLIATVQLVIEVIEQDPTNVQYFQRIVPGLVKLLKNLLSIGYSPEHDISGITDPFLQVNVLHLFRLLGKDNADLSDDMNDILAQVATNTETAKTAGNAILYECVQTIMAIESESGLRVLAINILGRFLLNRDNNIRYVALNTLSKVVVSDVASVQRHRNTIVECLKDPDVSIRQRALELIYQLVNETNVRTLAREMLNYLVVAPLEHKPSLCSKIADVVDQYAPSPRWQIDTLITMLSIAGSYLQDEGIINSLIMMIQQNQETHSYVVHKLYWAIKEDMTQLALVHVAVWCIGEYGTELMGPPPHDEEGLADKSQIQDSNIIEMLKNIISNPLVTEATKAFVLNALIKLSTRITSEDQLASLKKCIRGYRTSMALGLQQRSCEYTVLLEDDWSALRKDILLKMPVPNPQVLSARRAKFGEESEAMGRDTTTTGSTKQLKVKSPKSPKKLQKEASLLDLDDIFGANAPGLASTTAPASIGGGLEDLLGSHLTIGQPVVATTSARSTSSVDLLSDLFSSGSSQTASMSLRSNSNDLMGGLLDFGASTPQFQPPPPPQLPVKKPIVQAYNKNGILIQLEMSKPNPGDPSVSYIRAIFTNANLVPVYNFVFQAAFPKSVKLQMEPPSGNVLPPSNTGIVTQLVKVQNSLHGEKELMMKIKLQCTIDDRKVEDVGTVSSFPPGY